MLHFMNSRIPLAYRTTSSYSVVSGAGRFHKGKSISQTKDSSGDEMNESASMDSDGDSDDVIHDSQQEALRVGQQVLAIHATLQDASLPFEMSTIVELGTDSRYYVMVRGWLSEMLRADLSILDAHKGDAAPTLIQERVAFLKQAIRAIDLE